MQCLAYREGKKEMLVQSLQTKILEKVVRGKNGRLVRVRFEVTEIDGRTYGRILSVSPIHELKPCTTIYRSIAQLAGARKEKEPRPVLGFTDSVVSPFTSLEFFVSQMTRAPSA